MTRSRAAGALCGLALAAITSGLAVGFMLVTAGRGLDLMDESYVLRLVADPQSSIPAGEVYLFAFLVHPVFELLGEDVALLRVCGTLAVAAVAAWTTREALGLADGPSSESGEVTSARRLGKARAWTAMSCVAAASMLVFTLHVRVPGYRAVAILGLLVAAGGLARHLRQTKSFGPEFVGAGLWLTFVGKPTSAAAAAVVIGVLLLARRSIRPVVALRAVAGGVCAAAVTLVIAGLTPLGAAQYLSRGSHLVALLADHPSLPQMLGWAPLQIQGLLVFGVPFLVIMAGAWWALRVTTSRPWVPELAGGLALVGLGVATAVLGVRSLGPRTEGVQILSVTLVLAILALVAVWRHNGRPSPQRGHVRGYVVAICLLPWAYTVGSNVPITFSMAQANAFWVLALMLGAARAEMTAPLLTGRLALAGTLSASLVAAVVWVSYHDGLPAVGVARPTKVLGGTLILGPETARVGDLLHSAATGEGIGRETPVVDVTGLGAGYAVMLGGRPLGRAHLYGSWPGRVDSARYALSRVSCTDRARAYILYAPDNPSDVSAALSIGASVNMHADYETVVTFRSRRYDRDWDFVLLRPRPELAAKLGCASDT